MVFASVLLGAGLHLILQSVYTEAGDVELSGHRQLALYLPDRWQFVDESKSEPVPAVPPATATPALIPFQTLYLSLIFNGARTELVIPVRHGSDTLLIRSTDLTAAGADLQKADLPPGQWFDLAALAQSNPGIRYRYDEARQEMSLTLPASLLRTRQISAYAAAPYRAPQSGHGFVIDYDAYAQSRSRQPLSIYSSQRWFNQQDEHGPNDVISNTGVFYWLQNGQRYIRYESRWTRYWSDTQTRLLVGDTLSSAQSWSRSIRMAGLQFGHDFTTRPDLLTYPVATLHGSAVVPSAVELFVNGVQQYRTEVGGGPFVISQISGITGAGMASVVTRDTQGREVVASVPLYIDTRMLAMGYSTWSAEAGFIRHEFAQTSAHYKRTPVVIASARYGLNDRLTLEGHGEAGRGLVMSGVGGLLRIGTIGVVNLALSGSTGRHSGMQIAIGLQSIQRRFTVDVQTLRTVRNYADLAVDEGAPVPQATDRLTLALPFRAGQSLSASLINYRVRGSRPARIGTLGYTLNLSGRFSLNLSAYKDFCNRATQGISMTLSWNLAGDQSLSTTAGQQDKRASYGLQASRSAPYEGGIGWNLQAGRIATLDYAQAQTSVTGRYGEATLGARRYGAMSQAFADMRGSLVLMQGQTMLTRDTGDGFALISTSGFANVPVRVENRVVGRTGRSGYLLVTNLNPYQINRLAIDTSSLPAGVAIGTSRLSAIPPLQGGVALDFGLRPYAAASISVVDEAGLPLMPGYRAELLTTEFGTDALSGPVSTSVTGYDGLLFFDGLKQNNRIRIKLPGGDCEAVFDFRSSETARPRTIGPLVCRALPNPDKGATIE